MSTGPKIPLRDAEDAAIEFFRLIEDSCERHTTAGSVRRRQPEVGDIVECEIVASQGYDLVAAPVG